jgi:hypothetical protein
MAASSCIGSLFLPPTLIPRSNATCLGKEDLWLAEMEDFDCTGFPSGSLDGYYCVARFSSRFVSGGDFAVAAFAFLSVIPAGNLLFW